MIENKVLTLEPGERSSPHPRPAAGPPWRIGWFGIIRCRSSFDLLSRVTRDAGGAIEVVLRGKPSMASFVDLERRVAAEPFIHFAGPYRNPEDLPAIYGDVHFAWAVDYFEAGGNSDWLLPNRIYESCAYGAPPIALAGVETGRWLTARGIGLALSEPLEIASPRRWVVSTRRPTPNWRRASRNCRRPTSSAATTNAAPLSTRCTPPSGANAQTPPRQSASPMRSTAP